VALRTAQADRLRNSRIALGRTVTVDHHGERAVRDQLRTASHPVAVSIEGVLEIHPHGCACIHHILVVSSYQPDRELNT
jgi:hypothetical protein